MDEERVEGRRVLDHRHGIHLSPRIIAKSLCAKNRPTTLQQRQPVAFHFRFSEVEMRLRAFRRLTMAILSMASVGCAAEHRSLSTSTISAAEAKPQGRPIPDGWQLNEVVMPARDLGPVLGWTGPSRFGRTPDGLFYRFFADGSGSILQSDTSFSALWSFVCQRDAMTDERKCTMRGDEQELLVLFIGAADPTWVCLKSHDFPGRVGAIRIEAGQPVPTDKNGCLPGSFAKHIAQGKSAATRYVAWPYDYPVDNTTSLMGFKSGIGLVSFVSANIDRLQF